MILFIIFRFTQSLICKLYNDTSRGYYWNENEKDLNNTDDGIIKNTTAEYYWPCYGYWCWEDGDEDPEDYEEYNDY